MTAAERQARESGADQKTVMDEGAAVLDEGLASHKFADYDSFMWVMLCEELKSRDAELTKANRALVRPLPADFTQARRARAAGPEQPRHRSTPTAPGPTNSSTASTTASTNSFRSTRRSIANPPS
jgi:hypothetical protein